MVCSQTLFSVYPRILSAVFICRMFFAPPFNQDYAGEEILICYDADFRFGQNFYIATTEEAKNKLLHVRICELGNLGTWELGNLGITQPLGTNKTVLNL